MSPTSGIPDSLSKQQVHLWLCEPEKISEPLLLQRYRSWLTPEEDTKRLRYRFEKHQHQYLITRALIRSLLSHYMPATAPQNWRFDQNKWGKPSLPSEQNPQGLRFNLSHTDGLIACALTLENDLGVDVEDITREGETVKIADRYFSPQEYQQLIALPETRQNDRFFDLWTLKESYIKAWGKGLAIPLDEFSFSFREDDASISEGIRLSTQPQRQDQPEQWRFWSWQFHEQHRLSLGIRNKTFSKQELDALDVKIMKCVPLISQHEVDEGLLARHGQAAASPES